MELLLKIKEVSASSLPFCLATRALGKTMKAFGKASERSHTPREGSTKNFHDPLCLPQNSWIEREALEYEEFKYLSHYL